jgi:hypothetical protein
VVQNVIPSTGVYFPPSLTLPSVYRKESPMPSAFAWYLDLTPNQMFSLYAYPIPGKRGLPLCQEHGQWLELKEAVVYDEEATRVSTADH